MKCKMNGNDWTVVRHKSTWRNRRKNTKTHDEDVFDEYVVEEKLAKVKRLEKIIEASRFWQDTYRILHPPSMEQSSHKPLFKQVLCFGIGSPTDSIASLYQLSFLALIHKSFTLPISVYVVEPLLKQNDIRLIEHLCFIPEKQFPVEVNKTTLFFMPHCEKSLYRDLIEANADKLTLCYIIGNDISDEFQICVTPHKCTLEINTNLLSGNLDVRRKSVVLPRITRFCVLSLSMFDEYEPAFNDTSYYYFENGN